MKKSKKIAWQKYEDVIENQIKSPLSNLITQAMLTQVLQEEEFLSTKEEENDEDKILMIPESLSNEIQLVSNFDCWIGHTNFNLTEDIKNKMNKIDGIEVLKICSRYRFFIGIGKCFEFKEVREQIEKEFLTK